MPVYSVEINHLTQVYQNTRVQELEVLDTSLDQEYSLCLNFISTCIVRKFYLSVLLILLQKENNMCDPLVTTLF